MHKPLANLHTTYHTGQGNGAKASENQAVNGSPAAPGRVRGAQSPGRQASEKVVNEYCLDCHDSGGHAGDVVLDPAFLAQPGDHAEFWERVIKQLRAKTMPPVGNRAAG